MLSPSSPAVRAPLLTRDQAPFLLLSSLRIAAIVMALVAIGTYLLLGYIHLRYPFELEWMEGGILDAIARVAAGQPLYTAPTVEYVPFIYAPLYFYVAAASTKIFGVNFFAARLVSYLSSMGVILLIGRFVQRETRSRVAGVIAAGTFAATYEAASCFFDIARVDSLFLLLVLGGLYLLRFRPSTRGTLAAALLFALATLAKQSAVLILAPMALYVLTVDKRRGLLFGLASGAMIGGSFLALNLESDGWLYYYVFWLPSQHTWVSSMWVDFWRRDLMEQLSIACVAGIFVVVTGAGLSRRPRRFYTFAAAGLLIVSWTGRLHVGGWPNVIMPGFAVLAIFAGLAYAAASRDASVPLGSVQTTEVFALLVIMAQFAMLHYQPRRFVPTAADARAGEAFVDRIRGIEGEVFIPSMGYITTQAGKRAFAHEMAIIDVANVRKGNPAGRALSAAIDEALAKRRFGAVILNNDFHRRSTERSYKAIGPAFAKKDVFWPVIATRTRPKTIYTPNR